MRLIDADAKIVAQFYDDEHEEWILKEMTVADYLSFSDTSIPFVDAVPVVRCRECFYYHLEARYCENTGSEWDPSGFCSDGERKDGADNG